MLDEAEILPAGHSAEISSSQGHMQNVLKVSCVGENITMLSSLRIMEYVQQELGGTALLDADTEDITEWCDIDDSADVREAM